jgi:hypothetical protein
MSQKTNPATYQTTGGCYANLPSSFSCPNRTSPFPLNMNGCFVKSRHYLQPWTERPSYYLDLTQPFVGGRAVYQAHNVNAIPRIVRYDTVNLANRNFMCQQPYWCESCL